MCNFKRFSKKNCTSVDQRKLVASEYISRDIAKTKVLKFTGLSRSTFYYKKSELNKSKPGRPIPGYSKNTNGTLTSDEWILKKLKEYREDLNFQNGIGCRALHEYLELDYQITVNHKKIYRLCKENKLLLSRKKKIKKQKNVANNIEVIRPNQLWQFDIKYGYIHGENRPFYLLAFVDVFTKKVISYHLGTNCTKENLILTLNMGLNSISISEQEDLIIRSDNGPQMSSNAFKEYVEYLDLTHEFTPIRCPNKNAFIESFFSIFEIEFLQVRYFINLKDLHTQVYNWITWYNERRLHASLKYNSPKMFLEKFNRGKVENFSISA